MAAVLCSTHGLAAARFRSCSWTKQNLRQSRPRPRAQKAAAPMAIFGGAKAASPKQQYICRDCGYIYDGRESFESLDKSYRCPVCSSPKRRFKEYAGQVEPKANKTDTRKARKAEIQEDTDFTPLFIAGGAAIVGLVALYFVLNTYL